MTAQYLQMWRAFTLSPVSMHSCHQSNRWQEGCASQCCATSHSVMHSDVKVFKSVSCFKDLCMEACLLLFPTFPALLSCRYPLTWAHAAFHPRCATRFAALRLQPAAATHPLHSTCASFQTDPALALVKKEDKIRAASMALRPGSPFLDGSADASSSAPSRAR